MNKPNELEKLVEAVRSNPRYQIIDEDLVRRIGASELTKRKNLKEAVKRTRAKLHQVGSAYQESGIDYAVWLARMKDLPRDLGNEENLSFLREMMRQHASTNERLPLLPDFYAQILAPLGPLSSILDLACGLNPLTAAFMPLGQDVQYFACDIYTDMIAFLNQYFQHYQIQGQAFICDLTQDCPKQKVQLALLLKTLPCLMQLEKNISGKLLDAINADHILVTFPARSLGGRSKGMVQHYESQFNQILEEKAWTVKRYEFPTELAFLLTK
jgi:16S rRNA (guanine(1405)-N(7))-methyltransferase